MKYIKCIFVGCFMCFIALVGLTTINNKNEKSMTEGRTLKQFPNLEYNRLVETDYLGAISDAFSDQVTGREKMIASYNNLMVNVLGQKWVGSIAIGKNKQLFQEPEVITDEDAYEKEVIQCAQVINQEAKKVTDAGSVFIYINYPRKDVVENKYLPDFYLDSRRDYQKLVRVLKSHLSEDVVFIDAYEILKKQDKSYYSNDHHVNFQGQMLVYQKVMSLVQETYPHVKVYQESDYKMKKTVVDGSFNRRIGYAVSSEKEVLRVKPKFSLSYTRKDSKAALFGKGKTYASAFMGGDYGDTLVATKVKKNSSLPSIFITGSSYTNSLEALCVGSFRSMHSVDYRSNTSGKTMVDYVKEEKPDYVVYIPNQSDKHFSLDTFKIHLGLK